MDKICRQIDVLLFVACFGLFRVFHDARADGMADGVDACYVLQTPDPWPDSKAEIVFSESAS